MRIEAFGMLVIGCLLFGLGFVGCPVDAKPLAYRAEFSVEDGEFRELRAFLRSVNAACERGDVVALQARLTPAYWTVLTQQLRHVGRSVTPATLRAMGGLLPAARPDALVVGRSAGNRIAVVLEARCIGYRVGESSGVCLTCVPILWDGRGFRLAKPALRHAGRLAAPAVARALAMDWLSKAAPGMNVASIRRPGS